MIIYIKKRIFLKVTNKQLIMPVESDLPLDKLAGAEGLTHFIVLGILFVL